MILAALAVVIGGALALTFGPTPAARAQAPIVLKIQASWPASLTLFEHLKLGAERVDKLSNGTLKIEPLPAETIVPAFEVLDATNTKVIDGAHTVAYYWVGKNKTAVFFTGGPAGNYGMDFIDVLGWMYEGGGNGGPNGGAHGHHGCPIMTRAGYDVRMSAGTITAGGTLGAFLLSIIYRVLTWRRLRDACSLTLQQSSMILFLMVASNVFGAVFARLGSANVVTKALLSIPFAPMGMLFVVMALIFLLGWPWPTRCWCKGSLWPGRHSPSRTDARLTRGKSSSATTTWRARCGSGDPLSTQNPGLSPWWSSLSRTAWLSPQKPS